MKRRRGLSTTAVHSTHDIETPTRPISPPITLASVHRFEDLDTLLDASRGKQAPWSFYRRYGHANGRLLEEAVRDLEGGEDAVACNSGMAAAMGLFWCSVGKGDHIVAAQDIYGGTYSFLGKQFVKLGVEVSFVESTPDAVAGAMRTNTKIVFFETITNPLIRVPDMKRFVDIAHKFGARAFVDNTFASPILCRPLEWGADAVYHSGTKFLGGHGDAVSGVLVGKTDFILQVRKFLIGIGGVVPPFDAWLTLRGLKTLALRVPRASENALAVARLLAKKKRVFYPGLPSDASHVQARKYLKGGFGPMLSFDAGSLKAAKRFVKRCRLVELAPSLGDVSTTSSHPARSSHAYLSPEERRKVGVTDGLLRISVGVEDIDDLLEDFSQAIK